MSCCVTIQTEFVIGDLVELFLFVDCFKLQAQSKLEYGKGEFVFTKSFRWFQNIAKNTLPQIEIKKNGNELYNFKNTAPNIFLFTK